MNDADKEKIKLTATALNNFAVATVTIGIVTPLIAYLYKSPSAPPIEPVVALGAVWLAAGGLFHVMARNVLEDLRE